MNFIKRHFRIRQIKSYMTIMKVRIPALRQEANDLQFTELPKLEKELAMLKAASVRFYFNKTAHNNGITATNAAIFEDKK